MCIMIMAYVKRKWLKVRVSVPIMHDADGDSGSVESDLSYG